MSVRSILCPVDFSAVARQAHEYALALAAQTGARLTVMHAIEPLLAQAAASQLYADYLRDTHAELKAFTTRPGLDRLPWAPPPVLVVTVGEPWREILAAAEVHGADLIVMGTQGLGGVRHLVFGSTAERVLRGSRVPLVAVPPADTSPVRLDADGPHFPTGAVIAALDLGATGDGLARAGAEAAAMLGTSLVLAHAVRPLGAAARWRAAEAAADQVARATAQVALDGIVSRLGAGVPVEVAIVTGHPAEAITELAASRQAALLLLGTSSGLRRHRPGSTAYRMLCLSRIPVLAVPPMAVPPASHVPVAAGCREVW